MELGIVIVALLVIGLGLVQAWTVWYVKREVARLDHRLDESLDDEDLLQFQERLQGLLAQTKDAGLDMVSAVDRRQAALERALEKVREAELKLAARAELLGKAADAAALRTAKLDQEEPPRAKAARPTRQVAKVKTPAPPTPAPKVELPEPAKADETAEEQAERNRTYLVRSATPAPSRHQKIYDLSDQGLSREQIARETDTLPGEVDLILNLRPKRRGKG